MKYDEWLEEVPDAICNDALWRMQVYRLALFSADLAWRDTCKLVEHPVFEKENWKKHNVAITDNRDAPAP